MDKSLKIRLNSVDLAIISKIWARNVQGLYFTDQIIKMRQ